jgi:hypothetical protein
MNNYKKVYLSDLSTLNKRNNILLQDTRDAI